MIENNLIDHTGETGIDFSGDPNASGSIGANFQVTPNHTAFDTVEFVGLGTSFDDERAGLNHDAAVGNISIPVLPTSTGSELGDATDFYSDQDNIVPFGRILNNTIYDAVAGVMAVNASSPTVVNNIFANMLRRESLPHRALPACQA